MPLVAIFKRFVRKGSVWWYLLAQFRRGPFGALLVVPYSMWLTLQATGRILPLRFVYSGRFVPVKIYKARSGKIKIGDKIILESWAQGNTPILINVGERAVLEVENELTIGHGTLVLAQPGSLIKLKGKLDSTGSGITCDTRIMAEKLVEIGYDCIIAWGCSITDSNWHELAGAKRCSPVSIGNKVWIGHDVSILPGSQIGDGCVVGAKSLVLGGRYERSSLLVGIPARVIRDNVIWSR